MNAESRWLREDEWQRIQRLIPIACVDAFAIRGAHNALEIGLILRETPDEGPRWCLTGGRLLYGEALLDGLARHVRDGLGSAVTFETTSRDQPLYVAQYAPQARPGFARDPRRHAVRLTFAIELRGVARATGDEAVDFRWFRHRDLTSADIGFGQARVLTEALARLRG